MDKVTKESLIAEKLLTREELGDMYYELRDKYHSYFSPWSNMIGAPGDPEATKKEITAKMAALEKELGYDFLFACRLKIENRNLETHLKDQCKNNDELEERIERLERCIVELRSGKEDRQTLGIFSDRKDHVRFDNCESSIPSKMSIDSNSYPSLL